MTQSNEILAQVIGRKARNVYDNETVSIETWEPFGAGMCDVRVRTESGRVYWTALSNLRSADGVAFPSRREVCLLRDRETLFSLRKEREDLKEEIRNGPRWIGSEFGKALLGRSYSQAIEELENRLGE